MKVSAAISIGLFLLGMVFMSVKTQQVPLGPMPEIEKDPLNIKKILWDKNVDALILIRDGEWAKIDLKKATLVNQQFEYDIIPEAGNSFTSSDFVKGLPDEKVLTGFVEVPLLTSEYASFGYKQNGEPWHDHSHKVTPPLPLGVGFYRSQGHLARDNRTFWGSYLFAMPERRLDRREGVEVFYRPGFRTELHWHTPTLFPYGPSLVAVCLLIFIIPIPIGIWGTTFISLVAIGLHLFSSLIFLWGVRFGEAWSGPGPKHNAPFLHMIIGLAIIGPLVLIKYANTSKRKA